MAGCDSTRGCGRAEELGADVAVHGHVAVPKRVKHQSWVATMGGGYRAAAVGHRGGGRGD